jgi:hypothetical protein
LDSASGVANSRGAIIGANNINRRNVNQSKDSSNSRDTYNSRDANNRRKANNSWDANSRRKANNIRDARSVWNTNSRKDINSSRAGGDSRELSHSLLNSSKNNNSSRAVSNSRDHYNSWDPRKANGNNIGHSRVSSNSSEATGFLRDFNNIRDASSNRDNSNSSVASNFAFHLASKMSSVLPDNKVRKYFFVWKFV